MLTYVLCQVLKMHGLLTSLCSCDAGIMLLGTVKFAAACNNSDLLHQQYWYIG